MKKSRYGQLLYKLETSGINGVPAITDVELVEFDVTLIGLIDFAIDVQDRPLKMYLVGWQNHVRSIMSAREINY